MRRPKYPFLKQEPIKGASGGSSKGGGSSSTATVAPDSLASTATAQVLLAMSEGPIGGLWTGDAKSIRLNGTPIQNTSGTLNYLNVVPVFESGTASQAVVPGFVSAQDYFAVGVEVLTTATYTATVSGPNIDQVSVDIQYPELFSQSTSTGDVSSTNVSFSLQTKLTTGSTWATFRTVNMTSKCSSSVIVSYIVNRPAAGTWNFRVVRNTPDNSSSTLQNRTFVSGYTEIQNVQEAYDNTAVMGLTFNAQYVGTSVPTVSADLYGLLVSVPDNYNVITRAYTGTWDGSFSGTAQLTNNPAWVLWDMMTNTRYGMGIPASSLDQFSFYDVAQYCDGGILYNSSGVYVSGGIANGNGGYTPRYTFNGVINQQLGSWDAIRQIASIFHGQVTTNGSLYKLVCDMPGAAVKLVTNSNVINDGQIEPFVYSTPSSTTAYTACRVTYNEPTYNYLEKDVLYTDSTQTQLPYLQQNTNGFGITDEGQARRLAHWIVDSSLYSTMTVAFRGGPEFSSLEPFDIVSISDSDYEGVVQEARIVSLGSNSVTLDRTITIGSTGTWTIAAVGSNGVTIETATITTRGAVTATLALSTNLTGLTNSTVQISGAVVPEPFRILSVKETSASVFEFVAVQYDVNKYARIDGGVIIPTNPFAAPPSQLTVSPVSNFVFTQESSLDPEGDVTRSLHVEWSPSASDLVTSYSVTWSKNNATPASLGTLYEPRCDLPLTTDALYTVNVIAYNSFGKGSTPASGSFTTSLTSPSTVSALPAVNTLETITGSTTLWTGGDLKVQWLAGSNTSAAVLKQFAVTLEDGTTSLPFTSFYVDPSVASFVYPFSQNVADNSGTANRNIKVVVQEQDTNNLLSAADTITVDNPPPAVPTNITSFGTTGGTQVSWAADTTGSVVGYLIWGSTTSGFTPSSTNLLAMQFDSVFTQNGLTKNATWYYKIAAYDIFGPNQSGTGLNVSSQYSCVVGSGVGVESGSSLPTSGMLEGDVFFLTTTGKIYRYHSGAWTTAVDGADVLADTITSNSIATGTILAVNIASGTITGTLIAASTIAGSNIAANTINSGNIAAGAITTATLAAGAVTASTIASGTITSTQIAANTIVAANIASGVITATQIASGTITSTQLAANSVTATQLAAGSITAGSGVIANLAVGTIQIASGAISTVYSATSSTASASVSVTIPSGARCLIIEGYPGSVLVEVTDGGGKDGGGGGYTYYTPAQCKFTSSFGTLSYIGASAQAVLNPTAGSYTITMARDTGGTFDGNMVLNVTVTQR